MQVLRVRVAKESVFDQQKFDRVDQGKSGISAQERQMSMQPACSS